MKTSKIILFLPAFILGLSSAIASRSSDFIRYSSQSQPIITVLAISELEPNCDIKNWGIECEFYGFTVYDTASGASSADRNDVKHRYTY